MLKREVVILTACILFCCAGCAPGQKEEASGNLVSSQAATGKVESGDSQSNATEPGETSSRQETQNSSTQTSVPTDGPLKLTFYGSSQGGYEKVGEEGFYEADRKIYETIEELYEDSDQIVLGTIQNTQYFEYIDSGYTIYDFKIDKVYKGNLKAKDQIEVLSLGGYIRVSTLSRVLDRYKDKPESQQRNGVVLYRDDGAPLAETGQTCLLFLGNPYHDEAGKFPKNAYGEMGSYQGRFVLENGNRYSRYQRSGKPRQVFSLSELEQEIAACQ